MTPRAKAFAAHIEALCEVNRITIQYDDKDECAFIDDRGVRIRPIRGDISYASALHEIGHILARWKNRPILVEETGAWLWAEKNAIAWTEPMSKLAARCLASYYDTRKSTDHVPTKPHEFWRLLHSR